MELYNKFTSNQNKGMVWKLLCDYGIFNTIPENKAPLVKDAFDRKFETLAKQITPMDNLTNLDKRIIEEMMYDLNNFAKEEIYNAAEIAEKRKKAFQEELSFKYSNFHIIVSCSGSTLISFTQISIGCSTNHLM